MVSSVRCDNSCGAVFTQVQGFRNSQNIGPIKSEWGKKSEVVLHLYALSYLIAQYARAVRRL